MCSDSGDAPFNISNAVELLSKRKFEMHSLSPLCKKNIILLLLKTNNYDTISGN